MNPPFASASIVAKPQCNQPSIASRAKQVGLTCLSTERSRRGRALAGGRPQTESAPRTRRAGRLPTGRTRSSRVVGKRDHLEGFTTFCITVHENESPLAGSPSFRACVQPSATETRVTLHQIAKTRARRYRNSRNPARKAEIAAQRLGNSENPPARRAQLRPGGTWRRRAMRMRTPAKRAQFRPSGELGRNRHGWLISFREPGFSHLRLRICGRLSG